MTGASAGPDAGGIQIVGLGYSVPLEPTSAGPSGARNTIIHELTLQLHGKELTALVGASGCGKSTLLRLLAGLRSPTAGAINGVPERRAFVFQDHALLPWLTLAENVALPGRYRDRRPLPVDPSSPRSDDVSGILGRLGLAGHARKLLHELSGGQRMRGSIARALYSQPQIVFLDEAFSALDGITRRAVQGDFVRVARGEGWTVVWVTHDLGEALAVADRVVAFQGPPLRVVLDRRVADVTERELILALSASPS